MTVQHIKMEVPTRRNLRRIPTSISQVEYTYMYIIEYLLFREYPGYQLWVIKFVCSTPPQGKVSETVRPNSMILDLLFDKTCRWWGKITSLLLVVFCGSLGLSKWPVLSTSPWGDVTASHWIGLHQWGFGNPHSPKKSGSLRTSAESQHECLKCLIGNTLVLEPYVTINPPTLSSALYVKTSGCRMVQGR